MFADKYLQRNRVPAEIPLSPDPGLGMAVIIPCYREPDILDTLRSLSRCDMPECLVEVIVLFNHSEADAKEIKTENLHSRLLVDEWIKTNSSSGIHFFAIGPVELNKKWAGAGLARKKGMDEAIERFNRLNNPDGILVSLDADTLVEKNYFIEIYKHFRLNPSHAGATISCKHQVEGLNSRHLQGIRLYEKYMHYYKEAMGYTGYPYPMFTIGSAFATRAGAYVRRGGMNRRKAGEDFYFLQNLVQLGKVREIKSTTVHPSARLSDRVPFGTGPVLKKWMAGNEELKITYRFSAFADLKHFFNSVSVLFRITKEQYDNILLELPLPVRTFLYEDNFWIELDDLNQNCATQNSFRLRFFQKFNAFKILKYLNFTHERFYDKADLEEQLELLNAASD